MTFCGVSRSADAWLLFEHARIGETALARLDPAVRGALAEGWAHALASMDTPESSQVLCTDIAAATLHGRCVSFGTLPALAADYACTPAELTRALSGLAAGGPSWLRQTLDAADRSAREMADLTLDQSYARLDVRRRFDIDQQIADPGYLDRAGRNHFLPASNGDDLAEYLRAALAAGAVNNAAYLFANYHMAALDLALQARTCNAEAARRDCDTLYHRSFLAEAFALHFLEDAFAAGHFATFAQGSAERKGTHDYYCQFGVDATLWTSSPYEGESVAPARTYRAFGDAYLTDRDLDRATTAVGGSLEQLACVLADPSTDRLDGVETPCGAVLADLAAYEFVAVDRELDVCATAFNPVSLEPLLEGPTLSTVWRATPRPLSRLPSFRDELGPFLLVGAGGQGGYTIRAQDTPVRTLLEVGVGAGVEGVLSQRDVRLSLSWVLATGVAGEPSPDATGFRARFPFLPMVWGLFELAAAGQRVTGASLGARVADNPLSGQLRWGPSVTVHWLRLLSDMTVLFPRGPVGYELSGSALRLRVGRAYSGGLTGEADIDLGLSYGHGEAGADDRWTLLLALSVEGRWYP